MLDAREDTMGLPDDSRPTSEPDRRLMAERRKLLTHERQVAGRRATDPISGKDAVRCLLELAVHEEYLAADLVARALSLSSRQVVRDWRRRKRQEVKVGRTVLLKSVDVLATYFPSISPASDATRAS